MHEYSIVRALLDMVDERARARRATSVKRLSVRIGELSGVEPGLLASAFEAFRENTLCARARLDIVPVPIAWVCSACGTAVERGAALECARCGGAARLASGDEILLESIEMEVA